MPAQNKNQKIFDPKYWEQGYFDLWSIIHMLSGAIWAFIPFLLNVSVFQAFCISAILLITWEILELFKNVLEPLSNRIVDILIGVVGYWALYFALSYLNVGRGVILSALVIFAVFTAGFSAFAWFSYSRYKDSFKKIGGRIIKVKK